jgi:hypothetical protein
VSITVDKPSADELRGLLGGVDPALAKLTPCTGFWTTVPVDPGFIDNGGEVEFDVDEPGTYQCVAEAVELYRGGELVRTCTIVPPQNVMGGDSIKCEIGPMP